MRRPPLIPKAGRRLLQAVFAYEIVALHSPAPTLTHVIHTCRRHPRRAIRLAVIPAAGGGLAWAAYHLLIEEVL